jgi:hypothetical protein
MVVMVAVVVERKGGISGRLEKDVDGLADDRLNRDKPVWEQLPVAHNHGLVPYAGKMFSASQKA